MAGEVVLGVDDVRGEMGPPQGAVPGAEQFGVALESWLVKTSTVVTERTIADLMSGAVGAFTREKSKRIEQALAQSAPADSTSATLTFPELAIGPGPAAARPTLPAGPAARKPGGAAR